MGSPSLGPKKQAMLSFKQFLTQQDDSIDESKAIQLYQEYKTEFKRKQIMEFFDEHKEEDWYESCYLLVKQYVLCSCTHTCYICHLAMWLSGFLALVLHTNVKPAQSHLVTWGEEGKLSELHFYVFQPIIAWLFCCHLSNSQTINTISSKTCTFIPLKWVNSLLYPIMINVYI